MGMMSVEHPDILKFLHAKQNLAAFTNFNVSVKVTGRWMENLLSRPRRLHVVINPRTGQKYLLPRRLDVENYTINNLHKLTAKPSASHARNFYTVGDIWKTIIGCAHKTGEPGIVFIDRINRDNPTPLLGEIEATNPCGEQPLLPYEACTLGSINLAKFVTTAKGIVKMNWPLLAQTVKLAARFLDNIIDACHYPVEDSARLAQANRKIGLGVMGFADCLFMLRIPYDSQKGIDFGKSVMKFIDSIARRTSSELAELRGPFPNWNDSIWRTRKHKKVRNASITCVAPAGTISIIADCSCGIEPVYSPVFLRHILDGRELLQVNLIFEKIALDSGFYDERLKNRIAKTGGIQQIKKIPSKIRRIFKYAYDIDPQWHIKMQAAFQQHCDAAVSKTVNLPRNAALADVDKAYKLAYHLGCKGITIYRRRSRSLEPMSLD
jgi:ribonucleoside-diphosphate reductase alpha chain